MSRELYSSWNCMFLTCILYTLALSKITQTFMIYVVLMQYFVCSVYVWALKYPCQNSILGRFSPAPKVLLPKRSEWQSCVILPVTGFRSYFICNCTRRSTFSNTPWTLYNIFPSYSYLCNSIWLICLLKKNLWIDADWKTTNSHVLWWMESVFIKGAICSFQFQYFCNETTITKWSLGKRKTQRLEFWYRKENTFRKNVKIHILFCLPDGFDDLITVPYIFISSQ